MGFLCFFFKLCAYPGAKALKGQIARSHYLTQPLSMFPPFPLFLILTLIRASSNSRLLLLFDTVVKL